MAALSYLSPKTMLGRAISSRRSISCGVSEISAARLFSSTYWLRFVPGAEMGTTSMTTSVPRTEVIGDERDFDKSLPG